MITPPPSSTLFPYTTLFRSPRSRSQSRAAARSVCSTPRAPLRGRASRRSRRARRTDRKSTRLNSSHTVISYAVFCLKKKNKKKTDLKNHVHFNQHNRNKTRV